MFPSACLSSCPSDSVLLCLRLRLRPPLRFYNYLSTVESRCRSISLATPHWLHHIREPPPLPSRSQRHPSDCLPSNNQSIELSDVIDLVNGDRQRSIDPSLLCDRKIVDVSSDCGQPVNAYVAPRKKNVFCTSSASMRPPLSVCLSVCMYVCLSASLSAFLNVNPDTLFIRYVMWWVCLLADGLSACLSAYLSIHSDTLRQRETDIQKKRQRAVP